MNFVRIAASAVIIVALMSVCANAKPIATARDTNLRQEPRMDGQILTLIPGGTKIEVGQCIQGWCKASWNGQDGYVAVQNLALPRMRPPGEPVVAGEVYGPPAAYPPGPVYGPPAYYGYRPYYPYGPYYGPGGYYGGWGYGGWGRRW
ncbi:MAG: SH3 domain-containing protein [Beijerinckiaceae bacterium]